MLTSAGKSELWSLTGMKLAVPPAMAMFFSVTPCAALTLTPITKVLMPLASSSAAAAVGLPPHSSPPSETRITE